MTMNKSKEVSTETEASELTDNIPEMRVSGTVLDAYLKHTGKADKALEDKDMATAIMEFEAALLLRPNMFQPYLMLGQIMQQSGNMHEALRNYEQANRLQPNNSSVLVSIAEIMFELGDRVSAKGIACDAIAIDDTYVPAITLLASVLNVEGDYDQAFALLSCAIEEQPEDASLWHAIARIQQENGDFENAEIFYTEALKFNPTSKGIRADFEAMKEARQDAAPKN